MEEEKLCTCGNYIEDEDAEICEDCHERESYDYREALWKDEIIKF